MHRLTVFRLFYVGLLVLAPWQFARAGDAQASGSPGKTAPDDPTELVHLAQRYDAWEQDFAKANALYCRAAKAGNAEAQFRLGWVYASGRGVPRDDAIAAALFRMAAEQGHENARRRLHRIVAQPDPVLPTCLRPDRQPAPDVKSRRAVETLVHHLAPQYAIDPQLVLAVITFESGFNANAVSPKSAQGLMQLIPQTAERFGVKKVFDPAENIKGGLAYLRWLMAFFQGDVKLVLAAYNAGEGAVERYRGIPPFDETRTYVQRISSVYRKATHPYNADIVAPAAMMLTLRRGG